MNEVDWIMIIQIILFGLVLFLASEIRGLDKSHEKELEVLHDNYKTIEIEQVILDMLQLIDLYDAFIKQSCIEEFDRFVELNDEELSQRFEKYATIIDT